MADDTTHAHRRREFLWLLGGIGVLLIVGLVVLLVVVTFYRAGPIRGHPQATPVATATPSP
ncbi:MAG TPA: hypothetical protein VE953_22280 [Terriglobales bacterium]|nr:hypothetical protein [Terriglobales bacterium]